MGKKNKKRAAKTMYYGDFQSMKFIRDLVRESARREIFTGKNDLTIPFSQKVYLVNNYTRCMDKAKRKMMEERHKKYEDITIL